MTGTLFDVDAPAAPFTLTVKPGIAVTFNNAIFNGHRKLTGCRVGSNANPEHTPFRVGACVCDGLRIELIEHRPWSGEVSHFHATRDLYFRDYVTPKAHDVLKALIGQQLHRYGGFDAAWRTAFRSNRYHDEKASLAKLAATKVMANYWQETASIRAAVDRLGTAVEYVYDPEPHNRHPRQIAVASDRDTRDWAWAQVDVRVLLDGEQVAWLDGKGRIWPFDNTLAQRLKEAEGR